MAYNNFYGYNQPNIDRINRQIEDLTNMRNQIQQQPQPLAQAPINNYINTGMAKVDLEGKIVPEGQTAKDIIVTNRTILIDEKNRKISIKEEDGTISKEYEIIIPKTPEEKKIEELEYNNNLLMNKLKEMEERIYANELTRDNEYSKSIENGKQSNAINYADDTSKSKRSSKQSNE